MTLYVTEIKAISPNTGELTTFLGPNVPGISEQDAQDYCENNGLGYCKVIGELIAEIPCKEGTYEPDWNKMIDYENERLN
jgi:hypothetical protein